MFEHGCHYLSKTRSRARRVTPAKLKPILLLHYIERSSLSPSSSSFIKFRSIRSKQLETSCLFQSTKWLFVGTAAMQSGRIRTHLKESYSALTSKEGASILKDLEGWLPLAHFGEDIALPQVVENSIRGLRLFSDGMQCRLELDTCVFSCRSIQILKKHWRDNYDWRMVGIRSESRTEAVREALAQKEADAWKSVHCQRFFATGQHAGYVVCAATCRKFGVAAAGARPSCFC
jgi:hypothetical protein